MAIDVKNLWASLGQGGFDHIDDTNRHTPGDWGNKWLFLIPANGTSPTVATQNGGSGNTTCAGSDNFVDGEAVPAEGLFGPFTEIELKAGEVYAYRAQ